MLINLRLQWVNPQKGNSFIIITIQSVLKTCLKKNYLLYRWGYALITQLSFFNVLLLNVFSYICGGWQIKNNLWVKCLGLHLSLLKQLQSFVSCYCHMKWVYDLKSVITGIYTQSLSREIQSLWLYRVNLWLVCLWHTEDAG